METKLFTVSSSPHIKSHATTATLMRDVLIALSPAMIAAIIFFGISAVMLTAVCVAVAV